MKKSLIGLFAGSVFSVIVFSPLSLFGQVYPPWQAGQQNQQLNDALAELRRLIAQGERDRAADPRFLADLKRLADKHQSIADQNQTSQGESAGPRKRILYDDFADGEFYRNPSWTVSAGVWNVDRSGSNIGLVSKIGRPLKAENLLNAILLPQANNQTQYASIYSQVSIPQSFTLRVKFTSKDLFGAFNISVYQGASAQNAYRIVYRPGAGVALQFVQGQNVRNVADNNNRLGLEDGKVHELVWARDAYGRMIVSVDNKVVVEAADSTLVGDFAGLLFINSGGAYWIRSVTVETGGV